MTQAPYMLVCSLLRSVYIAIVTENAFRTEFTPMHLEQCPTIYIFQLLHKLSKAEHTYIPTRLIEFMMGLRPRQGNLRLVFRLFSLMRGLPSIRHK